MGGLNSGPGPGITLLIAIVLILSQTASSAPLFEEDEGQESNSQGLTESYGCYYNFQHYNEGERILTNEPCLNCTCRNRMLMCYLRVCPFTKGIGQNCTVEKVPGQCCPVITCPEVPVQLLTSTTTEGIKTPDRRHGTNGTALGHLDTNGCNIDGIFYPNGAQVPGSPEKPCELCYCIRNKTACIMQECALHVDGCRPVYEEGQCFPVRYQCDDSVYEEEPTTTIRPAPTPGLVITTTSSEPLDCPYNNEVYEDGSRIVTDDPCEHCYCLKGKIACAVQECGAPLEKEGQNCTALPPAPGKCCPDSYQCDITMALQENQSNEGTTEAEIPSVAGSKHPADSYHPDQSTKTTDKPKQTTDRLHESASKGTLDVKLQELDRGTQNKSTENHLEGLHPLKSNLTSDYDQKITFPDSVKPSEVGRPEESGTKKPENDYPTEGHVIQMPLEKQPHPEIESHKQDVSTKAPQIPKHPHESDSKDPQTSLSDSSRPHGQNAFDPTTKDVLITETSSPSTKDPLLDKLHNIIQDVQSQVSDGKTTEMPEQVDFQTTPQSQTGHFTDRPDILSHLPHFEPQSNTSSSIETGTITNGSSPEDSNEIINKLQGIIQGIYSHATNSVTSTNIPEGGTVVTDTQSTHTVRPEGGSEPLSWVPEEEGSKPVEAQQAIDAKDPSGKPKPEDDLETKQPTKAQSEAYATEDPGEIGLTGAPDIGIRPQGSIKLPLRPKPGSGDEPHKMEDSGTTDVFDEDSYATENPWETNRTDVQHPDQIGGNKTPFNPEKYPGADESHSEDFYGKHPGSKPSEFSSQEKPFGTETSYGTEYAESVTGKPDDENLTGQYPGNLGPEHHSVKHRPSVTFSENPGQQLSAKNESNQITPTGSVKPIGHYPFGTEEIPHKTEYPEGATGRPEDYTKYPDASKPGNLPEKFMPTEHPVGIRPPGEHSGLKPSSQYSFGGRPIGQKPEKYKPGQHPESFGHGGNLTQPGQPYPEENEPSGQYPEKTKPFGEEEILYGTVYPDGSTRKPGSSLGHYPGGQKPTGVLGETIKPGQHHPEGNRPTGHHPFGHEEIPYGTEYPEATTYAPSDYSKYPESSPPKGLYPDKTKPSEETAYGVEFPGGTTGRPEDYTKYPEGLHSTEQYPDQTKPIGQDSAGGGATGQYPERVKPGLQYPEGNEPSTQHPFSTEKTSDPAEYGEGVHSTGKYPEKTKPAGQNSYSSGTEEMSNPELITGRPENYNKYPDGVRPTGEYPDRTKPVLQQGQYQEKPAEQYSGGSEPTGQYSDKTKPFSPEKAPYGTEYPEEASNRPEDYTKYPEEVRPTGTYPEGFRPENYPGDTKFTEGLKPTGPEKVKPTEQHSAEVGAIGQYPLGIRPTEHSPEGFEPTEQYPEGVRPTGQYSDRNKPTGQRPGYKPGQYPEELKPSSQHFQGGRPAGQEIEDFKPEEQTTQPGELYPEGSEPPGQYSDKTKPSGLKDTLFGTEHSEGVQTTGVEPERFKPTGPYSDDVTPGRYPEAYKPGQDLQKLKPGQQYPDEAEPFGNFETSYGTDYPESATGKPGHAGSSEKHPEKLRPENYPDKNKPIVQRPEELKPGQKYTPEERPSEQYTEKTKPSVAEVIPYGTEYPEKVTGVPEYYTKYPEGVRPTGNYPEEIRPQWSYPEGSKPSAEYPNKTKPSVSPQGTQYPERVTYSPVDFEKHPESEQTTNEIEGSESATGKPGDSFTDRYPHPEEIEKKPVTSRPSYGDLSEKKKPASEKYPYEDGSEHHTESDDSSDKEYAQGTSKPENDSTVRVTVGSEEGSEDTEYPESSAMTNMPSVVTVNPQKFRPVGDTKHPVTRRPDDLEKQTEAEAYGTDNPEDSGAAGISTEYPVGLKPGKPDRTSVSTKQPENVPEYGSSTEYSEETGMFKPEGEISEKHKPIKTHSEETKQQSRPKDQASQHQSKPGASDHPLVKPQGGSQYTSEEEPFGSNHPETTGRPSDSETKYPVETPYGTEYPDGVTVTPGYAFKPANESKYSNAAQPHGTGKYPEESEVTSQPENENGYTPDTKPGSPDESFQTENSETAGGQNEKPFGSEFPQGFKPTKNDEFGSLYPENVTKRPVFGIKYPDKVTVIENLTEKLQFPDGTKPDYGEPGTENEFQLYPGVSKRPQKPKPEYATKYPDFSGMTDDPDEVTDGNLLGKPEDDKYSQKLKGKPTSQTKETLEMTEVSGSSDKPEDINKYGEKIKKPEFTGEGSTESGYPEKVYITHYPEKLKPPTAEDQLLETGTKTDGLVKHPEKTKPKGDNEQTGVPGEASVPYDQTQETETQYHPEGFTKSPHTTKRPAKPTDDAESKRPDEPKPETEKPQDLSKYPGQPGGETKPVSEGKPFGITWRPDSEHPIEESETKGTSVPEYPGLPSGLITERPVDGDKYSTKPEGVPDKTEHEEAGTDKPVGSTEFAFDGGHLSHGSKHPEGGPEEETKYPQESTSVVHNPQRPQDSESEYAETITGRPSDLIKQPDTFRPSEKPLGIEEGVTGDPESYTTNAEEFASTGHYSGVTASSQENAKVPGVFRPTGKPSTDPESVNGIKNSEGTSGKPEDHVSGRPDSQTKYPGEYKPTEKYPERPQGTDKYPEEGELGSIYTTKDSEEITERPEESEKYPGSLEPVYPEGYKPFGQRPQRPTGSDLYSTEYPKGVTGKPQEAMKHPGEFKPTAETSTLGQHTKYPFGQYSGRPSGTYEFAEGSQPYDKESPFGTEYPKLATGKPESNTKYPEELTTAEGSARPSDHTKSPAYQPVEKFPMRPHETNKYPGGVKPNDSESLYGTEYPGGITEITEYHTKYPEEIRPENGEHTKYPEKYKPTGQHPGRPGAVEDSEGIKPDFPYTTQYPDGVTSTPEDYTKYPGFGSTGKPKESFKPTGDFLSPHGTETYSEEGRPGSIYSTEYPDGFTEKPEESVKYPEGFDPTGETHRPGDRTKHPVGQYPEKPHDTGSQYGTDYPEGATGKPDDYTKYPGGLHHEVTERPNNETKYPSSNPAEQFLGSESPYVTEYSDLVITQNYSESQHSTDKYGEEGKPHNTDSPLGTEYLETITGRPGGYTEHPSEPGEVFKPAGRPHGSDEYLEKGKPGLVYGTEYPIGITGSLEGYTKLPEGLRPTGDVTKHPEYPGKPHESDENGEFDEPPGSEYPERATTRPHDQTEGPQGSFISNSVQTMEHPGKIRPVNEDESNSSPGHPFEGKPTGVNYSESEILGAPTKHPNVIELHTSGGAEYPEEITVKPSDFKPTEQYHGAYPEKFELPGTGTVPNDTEPTEGYLMGSKYPGAIGVHVSGKYPEAEPEGTEYPLTSGRPEEQTGYTKYPDESSSSKQSQRPESEGIGETERPYASIKPPVTEDKLIGMQYPGENVNKFPDVKKPEDSEPTKQSDKNKYPESGKYPQKQKPILLNDLSYHNAYTTGSGSDKNTESTEADNVPEGKPHGIGYPESVTNLPEDGSLYSNISKLPTKYPQTPKPEEPKGSGSPGEIEKPVDQDKHPEKTSQPKPTESEFRPHETELTEEPAELNTEIPHGTDASAHNSQKPHGSEEFGGLYGTERPTEVYPEETDSPSLSSKYPLRPKPGIQKHPDRPKPDEDELYGSDDSTTEGPNAFQKYPEKTEPSMKYTEKPDVTGKPVKFSEGSKPEGGDAHDNEFSEKGPKPAESFESSTPEGIISKPIEESTLSGNYPGALGIAKYPPKPNEHYSPEHPGPIGMIGQPEDAVYNIGTTRVPIGSSEIPADDISTTYPDYLTTLKPGNAYLPLGGQPPNEKIPSNEQLDEDSVPEVSESSVPTETSFGFTDRIPASGSPSEDLFNNLHHFESLPDKPPSADLTHEHQAPIQESTTQHLGSQPTSQSSLPVNRIPGQKPEDNVPKKPSTTKPGSQYPGPLQDPSGDKYLEDISSNKPEDSGTHEHGTTKQPIGVEDSQDTTVKHPEAPTDASYSESLPSGGLTRRPVPSEFAATTPPGVNKPGKDSSSEVQETTPAENDLINKLHNIISGIQSQVTDSQKPKLPHPGYDPTIAFGSPTESSTDKFGKPVQRPMDSDKPSQGQGPDSSTDDVSPFENEIYDHTTTNVEDSEVQTDRPEFLHPSGGGSTEYVFGGPSKGPEGIHPDEVKDNQSSMSPYVPRPGKPETTEYPESDTTSSPNEFSIKPDENFSPTESYSSGKPSTPESQHAEIPQDPLTHFEASSTEKPDETTVERDRSTEHPHAFTDVTGNKKPAEETDNSVTEGQQQPVTQDVLHTVTPQDPSQKYSSSAPTDKPLHVVYPTYYPGGVTTRKPSSKPDEQTDKKVTVTPESILTVSESDSTGAPGNETHIANDDETETTSESPSPSPIVVVQEIHTEVHSERATTKPETEVYDKQTTKPVLENISERPQKPGEELAKHPETLGQTPQGVFGRPAISQPTGDEILSESQTLQPQGGFSEGEKSPNLPTGPFKQESTTKPGFVTVTPVGFSPFTKESEHIMHLYSPKEKHPGSSSSPHFLTSSTTERGQTSGFTESYSAFATDSGFTHKPEILGTRFPSRKTTQKPTEGIPHLPEGTTVIPTQGIDDENQTPLFVVTKKPPFIVSTDGLPTDATGYVTEEETTRSPEGASYVPYKFINGTKIYYPEKETLQKPYTSEPSPFDGYDHIPYEIINGTKFFYPNRVVTPQPAFTTTTGSAQMGMYVPYKIVNGNKVYYTQDKPEKPEKFDGLDYVPFDIVNGTKVFYPERVTTMPPPSSAMYVPFKIINDTKLYYPKDAKDEPQDIPDEYDGFDYIPYDLVDGKKIFRPDRFSGHPTTTTERSAAMYVPFKLINGKKVYNPKYAQFTPGSLPEGYDGFDFVPYDVVNGTKVFHPERATPKPEQTTQTPAMFVPYKLINGTKVYFPKYAQLKPTYTSEGYDGFDYLPYEEVNGTKIFRPVTQKPEHPSTPAFYPNGMFVPYKIIDNKKVLFPKDAQHKPRPLKPGYDGVQYLPYEIINGTKVFYPEVTTPEPVESFMYVPFKFINGTKVYYADEATKNPEEISDGFEGFDYLPFKIVNGNKVFYPQKVTPTMGMYVPYKKVNGTKVYYPKYSSEKDESVPEGYDGVDYIPYEVINGTKVFYPDRSTTKRPPQTMYVPYKMMNGTKVYYPKDAQFKPHLIPKEYEGFDSLPYEIVNGTKVFRPEKVTEQPSPAQPQGMFVPYKIINGTKVYYPQEAHKRPHPLSDEYAGLDYIPYEVVNGTKVFQLERVTPTAVPAMYVPYKLVNGTKVFYPKHAQHTPQQISSEYDGFDYVPYEIVNGTQVFYPNRVPSYQGMYVPYKIINGEKIFYTKYAQYQPSQNLDGYDGFDYLPYENVNGTKVFRPVETVSETSYEQAMYVPYNFINGTKIYYPKYAQNKPHLVPEGYDGFDYIPYEIVNGTKVFDPSNNSTVPGAPGTSYKQALYVPYKVMNGVKIYQPKFAKQKPKDIPQGYDGFDLLPYDVTNGNRVFYPEQSTSPKQAMYVPYKIVNGTKVFYPKYAQYVLVQLANDYDGFEYVPYKVVNGEKIFQPEKATETVFGQAMYVPYKVINGTKVYYPKYAQRDPLSIPSDFQGFDYLPYEVVNGNKVFHPEQATVNPSRPAMYVPFKILDGKKVYYPKYAQPQSQLIPEGYDGFDYLPYDVVNGTKVFDSKAITKPTYLQGMYVPYKLANSTKVFHPKDAHNKPNRVPSGYDGADYVPYELVNNTKMFYPELISTVQPGNTGSAGMYVPFRIINNKKVFYPKEATPFPPTVRHPYDGVAFVPNKALPVSEIVYVDNEEALKVSKPGQVPGEGSCYLHNRTFANNSEVPPMSPCQTKCICVSSVVRCVRLKCPSPAQNKLDCSPVYREGSCCPVYSCGDSEQTNSTFAGSTELHGSSPSGYAVEETTPLTEFEVLKKPGHELGDVKGGGKPEEESPSGEYHIHKPPKPKPDQSESLEPYDSVEGQLSPDEDYSVEDEEPYGPGTCRYAGKVYVSAQQIPRDDPCDFCFCFRSDIICLQQSCPPPIPGCRDEPIQGFCCPRYECHVKMATVLNVTSTTTTTTTTLPPHFFPHAFKGSATKTGCFVQGRAYRVGQSIPSASGPCMDCICGGNGRMKCEPKVCTPEPMIRKMISPTENTTFSNGER